MRISHKTRTAFFVLPLLVQVAAVAATKETAVDVAGLAASVRIVRVAEDPFFAALGAKDYAFVLAEGWQPADEPVGAPQLPQKTVLIDLPSGATEVSVTAAATWRPLAEDVRVIPVQPPFRTDAPDEQIAFAGPDAASYSAAFYPPSCAEARPVVRVNGRLRLPVRVTPFRYRPQERRLEVAGSLSLAVSYTVPRSLKRTAAAAPSGEHVDYLVVAPPNRLEDWRWFAKQRQMAHPDLAFDVVSTADIYALHPFGEGEANRNPSESIHAYLRAAVAAHGIRYVLLGGPWWDGSDWDAADGRYRTEGYLYTGERLSLENTVPSVLADPLDNGGAVPCDMFYACLDLVNGQLHPWDGTKKPGKVGYGANYPDLNDIVPDVVVSRITLTPSPRWTNADGSLMTGAQLLTNYVAKLARVESPDWKGRYRYAIHTGSMGGEHERTETALPLRDEREFYDEAHNTFAPGLPSRFVDTESIARRRLTDLVTCHRPLLGCEPMLGYNWSTRYASHAEQVKGFYRSDVDYLFVYSHGNVWGAGAVSGASLMTEPGLVLFNACHVPCLTGKVDTFKSGADGRPCLDPSTGDGSVSAPFGGCVASVNNTRVGWFNISLLVNFNDGLSAQTMTRMQEALFRDRAPTVGDAFLQGMQAFAQETANGYSRWCQYESMLFGDPLVGYGFPDVHEVVTDGTTARGALRLDADGDTAIEGLPLKVQLGATVTNGNLTVSTGGGIGREGLAFVGASGTLTLNGDARFYLASVSNAAEIVLAGGGAVLDLDTVEEGTPLAVPGNASLPPTVPNVLRSATSGRLAAYRELSLSDSFVRLETTEAFGAGGFDWNLTRTKLSVFPGVQHPCEGNWERFSGTLTLDGSELSVDCRRDFSFGRLAGEALTLKVSGASAIRTTDGGRIGLVGTTMVELDAGAVLTLAADFDDLGDGKLVFTGSGRVIADAQLAGRVEVGAGVTFEMTAMPMTEVTDLTFDAASTLVLPESNESFYQLVALSATMTLPTETRVVIGSRDADGGVATSTGSFFEKKVVTVYDPDVYYMWESEGEKMFFPEIEGRDVVDVYVAGSVTSEFTYFGNKTTHYQFKDVLSSSVTLSAVLFGGPTTFEVPLTATHSVGVMAGLLTVDELTTPTVTVSSGGEVYAKSIVGLDGLADVTVARGGTLDLVGNHAMNLTLEDGAILKAVSGEHLQLSDESTVSFGGGVFVDVSGLALTDEPILLVSGNGHVWTLADLDRFRLAQDDAELRIIDGSLYVIAGAELVGPYARTLDGVTTWNGEAWTDAVAASFVWGDTATDWSDDVVLTLTGHSQLTVDTPAVFRRLSLVSSSSNDLAIVSDGVHAAQAREWDFSAAQGNVTFGLDVADATVILSGVRTILGGEAANVLMRDADGATVRFVHPGRGWRVDAPVRGVFEVVPASTGEPFAIVSCPDDFPYPSADFEVRLVDAEGTPLDMSGWEIVVRDGALQAIPPGVVGRAEGAFARWSELTWTDATGHPISISDWSSVANVSLAVANEMTIALDACVTNAVTLSGARVTVVAPEEGASAKLPPQLVAENDVVVRDGCLPRLTSLTMPSAHELTLEDGETEVEVFNNHECVLDGRRVQVGADATLVIVANEAAMQHEVDLSGVTGEGTVRFVSNGSGVWLSTPRAQWASTLSFETQADMAIGAAFNTVPLEVRNLSGPGTFRTDYQNGPAVRTVRTVQTRTTTWSGTLAAASNNRDSALTVASLLAAPSEDAALVLSGTAVAAHRLTVETNGCVILTGTWKGDVVNDGRLVLAAGATVDGTISGTGAVVRPATRVRATITSAVASWDDLAWTDPDGNPVSIYGGEAFDEMRLVLDGDMSLAGVNALAAGHEVTIEVPSGRTLSVSGRDWTAETIVGEGTLLLAPGAVTATYAKKNSGFAGKLDVRIAADAKYAVFGDKASTSLFASRPELSVTAADPASSTQALILNLGIVNCPLTVRNFSGAAYIRSDYNSGDGLRVIDTLMTEDREFSGVFMNNGNRKASLTVRGDGAHVLTLSGANATLGELRLADKGRVSLVSSGSWASGTVVVGSGCVLSLAGAKSLSSLTLEDGATLAFAAEGTALTVAAPTASGVVNVDPGALVPTETGVKLIGWTTAPTATFALRSDRTDCVIEKRTDGVYLTADAFVPVAGTDVKIPAAWVRSCPEYVKRAGGDLTEAVLLTTGKVATDGHETALWEEYVAGTDPDDADDLFLAFIAITNGVPYLSWQPDLNTNGIRRIYTIYGRSDLASGSPWQTPTNVTHRFFKVGVRLP